MTIANYRVVGALALPEGKAPFDRAPLILASEEEPGRLLQVTAYLEGGEPDGKAFALEDFQALLQSGQAIAFSKPFEASSGVALWVLRRNFAGREAALEELRASELMLRDYLPLPDGSFGCLVRERPAALELRDRWATQADAEARRHAAEGDWDTARAAASRAFALERAMSPERIAMLVLVYNRQGLAARAQGYLQMARRSRGEAFAAQTEEKLRALESAAVQPQPALAAPVPATSQLGPRRPALSAMRQAGRQHVQGGLRRLGNQAAA